jgi:hypothetical protein
VAQTHAGQQQVYAPYTFFTKALMLLTSSSLQHAKAAQMQQVSASQHPLTNIKEARHHLGHLHLISNIYAHK